jgi:hypothetical protein
MDQHKPNIIPLMCDDPACGGADSDGNARQRRPG